MLVGPGQPVYVIGEIGINHNGDLDLARQLIDVAADAGCQAVKFQKRTPEICVPERRQRTRSRQTPWGEMTYLEYKHRIEFGHDEYRQIAEHCAERGLALVRLAVGRARRSTSWRSSTSPATRSPRPRVTDQSCCARSRATGKPVILSTGMSTLEEIDTAVEILGTDKLVMMHATSTYPLPPEEANLRTITTLQDRYGVPVGYSGHERGLQISLAAVALGAVTRGAAHHPRPHHVGLGPRGLPGADRASSTWCATSGSSSRRWATASSASSPASRRPQARLRRVTV